MSTFSSFFPFLVTDRNEKSLNLSGRGSATDSKCEDLTLFACFGEKTQMKFFRHYIVFFQEWKVCEAVLEKDQIGWKVAQALQWLEAGNALQHIGKSNL